MPASSSDGRGRGRWKRRKRERRSKHQLDDKDVVLEEDEEEENNNDDLENSGDDAGVATTDPSLAGSSESEVLADGGVRISEFPAVVKRTVNRPHGSVMAIVASERAGLIGDSKGHQQVEVVVLENVSHGQLQAVSMESPKKYVITPPRIMEGRGVVRRFGNRVHVLPMHSEWLSPSTVHRLERQVVPLFFSGKSPEHMPEKYIECRNQIVVKCMNKPEKRIVVSNCQPIPTLYYLSQKELKRLELELKLKQFAEVETLLMKECEQVKKTRQSNNRQQVMSTSPSQPSISGYSNNQPVHPHMSTSTDVSNGPKVAKCDVELPREYTTHY
ncbi:hypothetical protein V6N13_054175 [Hibiscus sabdariffa]